MTILDAEYQFDRHKLTYYFEADRRIDFRELVSELFSLYKTRIWMQQVDTSVLGMNDAGLELAKATGFLPERDDQAYLATSHMHRTEGIHGTHAFQQGHGRGGGFGGHDDSRGLQYPPQLSQHQHPSMQQPQRSPAPAPGQRAEPSFQSPLYGGTWGAPGPQTGMGYGQTFGQQATTSQRFGPNTGVGQGLGQSDNTAFAYGPGGLLDAPPAPPQQALLQPLLAPRLPGAPQPVQAVATMQSMQPYQTELYAPGSTIGPPARSAAPQMPQLQQPSFFGNYGALPGQQAAQQEDDLHSYFQPKQAAHSFSGNGGAGRGSDVTYYPQEDYGGGHRYQLVHPDHQVDTSFDTLSPRDGDAAGGAGGVSDDRDSVGGEGGADTRAGDNASLDTFIEQWSLRDPR